LYIPIFTFLLAAKLSHITSLPFDSKTSPIHRQSVIVAADAA
jgi:hypothetical protein